MSSKASRKHLLEGLGRYLFVEIFQEPKTTAIGFFRTKGFAQSLKALNSPTESEPRDLETANGPSAKHLFQRKKSPKLQDFLSF